MHPVSREDYELLQTLARREGQETTLSDIAEELGATHGNLRYRLTRMGLRPATLFGVRTSLGNRPLSDLLASGEIVADDAPAPQEAQVA
jgi:hypothetical protein